MSYLTFKVGAMPKLQRLELRSWGSGSEKKNVTAVGVEHLIALEEFSVSMSVEEPDKKSVESASRSAVSMHPGNPRLVINLGR
jgi:hypothetical protein